MQNWKGHYKRYLEETGRSDRTVEAYLCDLKVFERWFEEINAEKLRPERVTATDCHDFRRHELKERKVAPSTWNRRRASLIVFVDWAMEKDLLNADPMDGVAKMKVEELPPEWLDEQQFRSLVRRLDQDVNRALSVSEYEMRKALMYRAAIALMLYAGLRVGEVVALVPDDLDINERSGKVIVRDGKGEKHREVPLSLKARKALTAWLEWKDWNEPGNPLWYGRKGDPLGVRAIQDYVKQLGHVLEIEMTPHSFRHTFGKRLADKGVPVPYIQKLMGHASMETTARYIQAGWDDLVDATESL